MRKSGNHLDFVETRQETFRKSLKHCYSQGFIDENPRGSARLLRSLMPQGAMVTDNRAQMALIEQSACCGGKKFIAYKTSRLVLSGRLRRGIAVEQALVTKNPHGSGLPAGAPWMARRTGFSRSFARAQNCKTKNLHGCGFLVTPPPDSEFLYPIDFFPKNVKIRQVRTKTAQIQTQSVQIHSQPVPVQV